jgi:hypothetical protein
MVSVVKLLLCSSLASRYLGHNDNEHDNTRHNDNAFSYSAAVFTVLHSVIMLIVVAPFKVICSDSICLVWQESV